MPEIISSDSSLIEVEVLIGRGENPEHIWASIPYAGRLLVDGLIVTNLGNRIKVGDRIEEGIPKSVEAEIGQYADGWSES